MKSPLRYQISEYDCGPTTLLNAITFLFEREEVPPEIIKNISLYSLDTFNSQGFAGRHGTSKIAMMFLSNWLNAYRHTGQLNISCEYLTAESVYIGETSKINDVLQRGGVVVVRLFYDVEHYVLLTGMKENHILMFDPYYNIEDFKDTPIILSPDTVFTHNRMVPWECFNKEDTSLYALGAMENREAVLLFNNATKRTAFKTIEYFI